MSCTLSYDPVLVALGVALSVVGAWCAQLTTAYAFTDLLYGSGRSRQLFRAYMLLAGTSLGGVGVWAAQVVAAQGLRPSCVDDAPAERSFDVRFAMPSLALAVTLCTAVAALVLPPVLEAAHLPDGGSQLSAAHRRESMSSGAQAGSFAGVAPGQSDERAGSCQPLRPDGKPVFTRASVGRVATATMLVVGAAVATHVLVCARARARARWRVRARSPHTAHACA